MNGSGVDTAFLSTNDRCCIVCNRFLADADTQICPTCNTDNSAWWNLTPQQRFACFPTGVLLAVAAMIGLQQWAYLFWRGGWLLGTRWATALLESLPVSLLAIAAAAVIYALRQPLRQHELKRKLKLGGFRLSLGLMALLCVLTGVILAFAGTLVVPLITSLLTTEDGAALTRAMSPIMPALSLPFITAAIMLVGVNTYVHRLQERFPAPIYSDANQMCEIVLKSLEATYLAPRRLTAANGGPNDDDTPVLRAPTNLEIESVRRNRRAGLDLIVREHVTIWEADQKGSKFTGKTDADIYDVSTDEWAHITRFEPRKRKIRLSIYEPDVKTGR